MMTASDSAKPVKISKGSLLIPSIVICLAAGVVGGGFAMTAQLIYHSDTPWNSFWSDVSYWQEQVCESAWRNAFYSGELFPVYMWTGRISGLLVGVVWCFAMAGLTGRLLRRGCGVLFRTVAMLAGGAMVGVAAGCISGVIVHLFPMLQNDSWFLWADAIKFGLYFGALAGLALGLVGGVVWSVFVAVVARQRRRRRSKW